MATPRRIRKEDETHHWLLEYVSPANIYNIFRDDLSLLEKTVSRLKSFLFGFLAKLSLVEFYHWMEHAFLNPERTTRPEEKAQPTIQSRADAVASSSESSYAATVASETKSLSPKKKKAKKSRSAAAGA